MQPKTEKRPTGSTYRPIDSPAKMLEYLQRAAQLELTTIPPYLTAMYTIEDRGSAAYQAIRDVVLEEMLHLNLVGNLMNSIGGSPKLTGKKCPRYPTFLPFHTAGGPYVQLLRASTEQVSDTFMAIEHPAPVEAPPEDDEYETIGQYYKAIRIGFECYSDASWFECDTGNQHADLYFGSGAGRVVVVTDTASAVRAIDEIVQQGEGAANLHQPLVPYEPWGTYENYGQRTDGTYGPILGSTRELSHYYKFKDIADGTTPLGATYPMVADPDPERFSNRIARDLAQIFDECYSALLYALETALRTGQTEPFFTAVFPLMQSVIPALARQLVITPIDADASPDTGPNAGPPFRWVDCEGGRRRLLRVANDRATAMIAEYRQHAYGDGSLAALVATLTSVRETVEQIQRSSPLFVDARRPAGRPKRVR